MMLVYTTMMQRTCKISFLARCDLLCRDSEGLGSALLTASLSPAHLLEPRPSSRQCSATETGDCIALRRAPIGQSPHEDRLPFFRQPYFAFAQITARGKRKQPPLGEPLDIAGDCGGVAM